MIGPLHAAAVGFINALVILNNSRAATFITENVHIQRVNNSVVIL